MEIDFRDILVKDMIQNAKYHFEKEPVGKLQKLGFNKLLRAFLSGASLPSLAREFEVSNATIYNAYKKYFEPFSKEKIPQAPVGLVRAQREERNILESKRIAPIVKNATSLGFRVTCIFSRAHGATHRPYTKKNALIINGYVCAVVSITSPLKTKKNPDPFYVEVLLGRKHLECADIFIFNVAIKGYDEHIFVVPVGVIREAYLKCRATVPVVKVPLKKAPHSKIQLKLDFWKYEEAWNVMKKIRQT